MFQLVIRCYDDDDYRHVVAERESKKGLDRIEDGVHINLDHAHYYTEIVEVDAVER